MNDAIFFRQSHTGGRSGLAPLGVADSSALPTSRCLSEPVRSVGLDHGTARLRNYSNATQPVDRHHKSSSNSQAHSQLSQVSTQCVIRMVSIYDFPLVTWCFPTLCHSNRKRKKASSELEDKMDALTLNELTQTVCEQRLTEMEKIFLFSTADPWTFPQNHGQEFIQQTQHLSPGNKNRTTPLAIKYKSKSLIFEGIS